jgi:hypothetical protein
MGANMFTVVELAGAVILASVGWCLVGWSMGYKAGMKDGYNRGRAAGLRWATDRVRNS